jgi:signal peptidase I
VSADPGSLQITTKGDANPAADPWHARIKAQSIQEVVFGVPWLGNAMVAMHGDGLRILLIVTAGLFVAITGAQVIVRAPRHRASAPA